MIEGTLSRSLFTALVVLVAAERVFELWLSSRNAHRTLARGGVEFGVGHYPWMALLHSSFLAACVVEVWLLERPFLGWASWIMLVLLGASMTLRYWAVASLGDRWNTRVICEPGVPAVTAGPYRFLRHPNYVAVSVELLALPLLHGAWLTALVFSVLNARMLLVRIRVEERALTEHCDYERLLPTGRRRTSEGGVA